MSRGAPPFTLASLRAPNPLPSWHPEDRPTYEKLIVDACSCTAKGARAVAEAFPRGVGLEYATMAQLRGLGLNATQARRLHGAFELARFVVQSVEMRHSQEPVRGPDDVCAFLQANMGHLDNERFVVFLLDSRQRIIDVQEVSTGSLAQVDVHPRELFGAAVRLRAHSIIVAHNHPSGDADPSAADVELTRRISEAGRLLGIPLLDHFVVARGAGGVLRCNSLAQSGFL